MCREKNTKILTAGIVDLRFLREVKTNSSFSKQKPWAAQSTPFQWLGQPLRNIAIWMPMNKLYVQSIFEVSSLMITPFFLRSSRYQLNVI